MQGDDAAGGGWMGVMGDGWRFFGDELGKCARKWRSQWWRECTCIKVCV